MRVKELIEHLQKCPPDAKVVQRLTGCRKGIDQNGYDDCVKDVTCELARLDDNGYWEITDYDDKEFPDISKVLVVILEDNYRTWYGKKVIGN